MAKFYCFVVAGEAIIVPDEGQGKDAALADAFEVYRDLNDCKA